MIVDHWHGVINRKGELLAVEESPAQAEFVGANLEVDPKRPTNRVVPVAILIGTPGEAFEAIVARVTDRIKQETLRGDPRPYVGAKKDDASPTDIK